MSDRIPVHIISGFLGSGKTTFLNHLIRERLPERIFVIENEVGDVNIDSTLVVAGAEEVSALSAGCLCCSLNDDLRNVLEEVSARRDDFDRLVIETTGIADPASIAQVFLGDRVVERYFDLRNVICLADAGYIEDWLENTDEARRQIAAADVVLLNKADKVNPTYLSTLEAELRGINPYLHVYIGEKGVFPVDEIIDIQEIAESGAVERTRQIDGDHRHLLHDISTFTLRFSEPFQLNTLGHEMLRLVNLYQHQIYRIKGVIATEGNPCRLILQSVRNTLALSDGAPWDEGESRESKIVFIGKGVERNIIEGIFRRHLVAPKTDAPASRLAAKPTAAEPKNLKNSKIRPA